MKILLTKQPGSRRGWRTAFIHPTMKLPCPSLRLVALIFGLLATALATPPPVSDFVKRFEVSNVKISEDGRYVSFLVPAKEEYYDLCLYEPQTKQSVKLNLGGYEIWNYAWIDANRLVLHYSNGAIQVYDAKLNKITGTVASTEYFVDYISSLRRDPNLFIGRFYEQRRYAGDRTGLGVIDIRLQPKEMAGSNNRRYNVKEWIDLPKGEHHSTHWDQDGEVRLITVYRNKQLQFHYRPDAKAPWQILPLDYETTDILGFPDDPDFIYLAHYSAEAQGSRLHRYQVSTNDLGAPMFEDPEYSMSEATLMRRRQPDGTSRILALNYNRDVYVQRAIDPVFAEVQATVNGKLPGRLNTIFDCDHALKRFVVGSASGREPTRYAVFDREKAEFLPLPAATPWFKPAEMSVKRPLKFTTRDGLVLEGYLSLPATVPAGTKPPLVVYPHGGPWARDTWGYDIDVQFLTSRGYAVFQPNYRGSTGYSKAVSKDDDFAFRKMHDDVTDGVKHVLAQGVVDENRVAIYGGSFGGYLAVAGVAFEPDIYRCAITFAGVFDWKQMIRQRWSDTDYNEFAYDHLLKRLGDPATQQARFENMSPIAHIAAIKAPVFVIHGKLDTTVDYRQSTKLLSELAEHRVPHEKLFFPTEFHGFSEPKNYQKFLEAVEKFLAKHL
jgi:acetyl esterase/lipase